MPSVNDLVEVRGEVDRDIVDVMDAISSAEGISRTAVLRRWLRDKADAEIHRSTLILRVWSGKGSVLETVRQRSGSEVEELSGTDRNPPRRKHP